jgi:hypothetical protein
MMLGAHLFGMLNLSKQVWSWHLVVVGTHLIYALDDSHSDWIEVKSQCHFGSHFLWPGMLNISSCIYWPFSLFPFLFKSLPISSLSH